MKTRPSAEFAVLGTLASGPKHGYEILQLLEQSLGSTWYVSQSQLYSLLKRLEREGLVLSTMQPQEGRPSKRVFSLTPLGRGTFMQWVFTPSEHVRDLRIEFLAKLFFIYHLSLQGADSLLKAQIRVLEHARERITQKRLEETDPYEKLVLEFKLTTLEAWLGWLTKEASVFVDEISRVIHN